MGNYYMPDGALAQCFLVVLLNPSMAGQCIICDSICAWRTMVIWNQNKRVTVVLVTFILVTTGT